MNLLNFFRIEAPDDEGETHDKRDSGENYLFKVGKPVNSIAGIVSAKRVDNDCAKLGALDGEENPGAVQEVISSYARKFFRWR